jgi:hypothetical protein
MKLPVIHGQPSWPLRSSHVHAHLTRLGGHLGPVHFRLGRRTVAPLSIAPWAEEKLPREMPALLKALRGDFFCAPFGGNGTPWRGEQHPPHGETANAAWRLERLEHAETQVTLRARLDLKVRPGRVTKTIILPEGSPVVGQSHEIAGARGPLSVGHHAMLRFPEEPGSGLIATSPFVRGQVLPTPFEDPAQRGYSSLQPGAEFTSLAEVPLATGGTTDLSVYPARRGFDDLVMITAAPDLPFAWNAVTFPTQRYVWFSLRDPGVLRHTIFWISNGGRHYAPWNGRHTGVLGLEDTTSYFHYGQAESAGANPLRRLGLPTTLTLDPRRSTTVRTLMGVAEVPARFGRVARIEPAPGGIVLVSAQGARVPVAVDLNLLR